MKQQFHPSIGVAVIAIAMASCAHLPTADQAIITDPQDTTALQEANFFAVDTTATYVRFTGHGVGKNHPGRFKLSRGRMAVANGIISGGHFTIAITSLQIEQPQKIYQTRLKSHLLSADFFDTAQYHMATFDLTDVMPYTKESSVRSVIAGANYSVSGNLTLKGITRNVRFPARIALTENTLTAVADFNLDRTQWGMYYGNDKSLGDRFISETVNIQLHLEAAR